MERLEKAEKYYENEAKWLVDHVAKNSVILDVGCGSGLAGANLKKHGAKEVIGLEVNKKIAEKAKKHLDKVIIGDAETISLPFKEGYFDYIIYGDILEHLVNPWRILKEHRRFLKDQGRIICSMPNIKHYTILGNLAMGFWPYNKAGILDETHLRFFTFREMKQMIEEAGYEIVEVLTNFSKDQFCQTEEQSLKKLESWKKNKLEEKLREIVQLFFGDLKGFKAPEININTLMVYQYCIIAQKKVSANSL